MLLAQISDLHLPVPGAPAVAGIDRAAALQRAVARLNALSPEPDLVVATGDLVDLGSAAEYAHLRELLAPLAMPLLLMPGNHDDRTALRAAFPDHPELRGGSAFLQHAFDAGPMRLLLLDTLRAGTHAGELCAERLAWLGARLDEQPDRPTVIFMHHPPLSTGLAHLDKSALAGAREFGEIVARHPQIERIACGHVHRTMTARWCGTTVTVCPSVVHQFALDLRATGGANIPVDEGPGFQLHRWHDRSLITYTARLDR
jgi:3',5'-cyclic-AMP phosphodiesterase